MIVYTTATTENDLRGILNLQKANLKINLPDDEITSQGFVTVIHGFDDLKKLNEIERHIIAKEENSVIAYLLAMTARSKNDIPVLVPMFEMFSKISFAGRSIAHYNYIAVGQVCVSKNYRGQGVLDNAYLKYKNHFKNKYDFAITEIASTNQRSLNAHKRIGFTEIHRYKAQDETEWVIVLWDWKNLQ
ncbi:MAG: GNAT family N-acetyltransferase [Chitinophagales bacterium]